MSLKYRTSYFDKTIMAGEATGKEKVTVKTTKLATLFYL